MTDGMHIEDHRDDLPIFIHSELDDLPLTLEAFRVYAHLARRAGKNNLAWPSYNSIGEACFRTSYPNGSKETLRRKAIAAVKELTGAGLVDKVPNFSDSGDHTTNVYRLNPRQKWGGSVNTLPSVNTPPPSVNALPSVTAPRSVNAPKGNPLEGTPLEVTPTKTELQTATATQPNSTPARADDCAATTTTGLGWVGSAGQTVDFSAWSFDLLTDQEVGVLRSNAKAVSEQMPPNEVLRFVAAWWQNRNYTKGGEEPIGPGCLTWRLTNPDKHEPGPLSPAFIASDLYRRHHAAAWEVGGDETPEWVYSLPEPPPVVEFQNADGDWVQLVSNGNGR